MLALLHVHMKNYGGFSLNYVDSIFRKWFVRFTFGHAPVYSAYLLPVCCSCCRSKLEKRFGTLTMQLSNATDTRSIPAPLVLILRYS